MNPWIGSALAALAVAVGWQQYGWQGLLFAVTIIVFWLLLQFSRTLRVMQRAGQAPKGRIDSAVRVQAKLRRGMPLLEVLQVAGSLGERAGPAEHQERWVWTDAGEVRLTLDFERGRLATWALQRPVEAGAPAGSGGSGNQAAP